MIRALILTLCACISMGSAYGTCPRSLDVEVRDGATGNRLAGASVELQDFDGNTIAVEKTDRNGVAQFCGNTVGKYRVRVEFFNWRGITIPNVAIDGDEPVKVQAEVREFRPVSLVALLARPEKFDGSAVRVVGFMKIAQEERSLYLHREDAEQNLTPNAVWVELGYRTFAQARRLSGRYVIVDGVFRAGDKGHMELYSGTIVEVQRLEKW